MEEGSSGSSKKKKEREKGQKSIASFFSKAPPKRKPNSITEAPKRKSEERDNGEIHETKKVKTDDDAQKEVAGDTEKIAKKEAKPSITRCNICRQLLDSPDTLPYKVTMSKKQINN